MLSGSLTFLRKTGPWQPLACPAVIDRRYRNLNRLKARLPDRPEARLPTFLRVSFESGKYRVRYPELLRSRTLC
jgi:hypothetical protein